jgi:hypothetical protein
MTTDDDIDTLKQRIAKAESERDSLRTSGREDKYLEAYVIVKALELQLDEQLRQPRRG